MLLKIERLKPRVMRRSRKKRNLISNSLAKREDILVSLRSPWSLHVVRFLVRKRNQEVPKKSMKNNSLNKNN